MFLCNYTPDKNIPDLPYREPDRILHLYRCRSSTYQHVAFTFPANQRTILARAWSKRLIQRGSLVSYGGEVFSTFHLLFEPRPKLPTQYRIVAARGTHSCPWDKVFAIEVFNFGGCSTVERGNGTHRGRVEDNTEHVPEEGTFARNWEIGDSVIEGDTYYSGQQRASVGR